MTGKTRRPSVRRRKPEPPEKAATVAPSARDLKIGEAAKILGVETFVLRFWETQFSFLKPRHTRSKHRFYQQRDLDVLRLIKRLLHDEGFTIAGANKYIRQVGLDELLAGKAATLASKASSSRQARGGEAAPNQGAPHEASSIEATTLDGSTRRVLCEVRDDLKTIKKMLEN